MKPTAIANNSGDAANGFDFDRDGLINLIEFAFDLDPTDPGSRQLPLVGSVGGELGTSFMAPPGTSGISYSAEWSSSLVAGSWSVLPNLGTGNLQRFSVPVSGRTRLFLRWRVTPQ